MTYPMTYVEGTPGVIRLRDETTGRPLLDPVTKKEMFEKEAAGIKGTRERLSI